jgi:hypothetical protein
MFWVPKRASLTARSTTQAALILSLKLPDLSPSSGGAAQLEMGKTDQRAPTFLFFLFLSCF